MTINANAVGTNSGDHIHHHEMLILPKSLSTIRTMVKSPKKPIPPLVEVEVDCAIQDITRISLCLGYTEKNKGQCGWLVRRVLVLFGNACTYIGWAHLKRDEPE